MSASAVHWHDLECGGYDADLPLWRELARSVAGDVLDVGCGSGRVALDLARRGHAVTGLDRDPALLEALASRADDLPVAVVEADARDFHLGREFGLVLIAMQTIQLMGGADGRGGLLRCAREHLVPGGLFAAAIADALEGFDSSTPDVLPLPDMGEYEGWIFSSQPVAVREHGDRVAIERIRQTVAPDGTMDATDDVVELDRVDAGRLATEGEAAGFAAEPGRCIDATDEHVGSEVVILRAP